MWGDLNCCWTQTSIKLCYFHRKCLNSVLGTVLADLANKFLKGSIQREAAYVSRMHSGCGCLIISPKMILKQCLHIYSSGAPMGSFQTSVFHREGWPSLAEGAAARVHHCLLLITSWQGEAWRQCDRIPQHGLVRNISVASTSEIDH